MSRRHQWFRSMRITGSVIPRMRARWAVITLLSIPTTYFCIRGQLVTLPLPFHAILGSAVGLHIAFRTNTGYERFWEARTAWGAIVNRTRNVARKAHALLTPAVANRVILLTIAFVHGSKRHFWQEPHVEEIDRLLGPDVSAELHQEPGPPQRTLLAITTLLEAARKRGELDSVDHLRLDDDLGMLIDQFGICQRIHSTPLPDAYVIQLRTALAMFLITLPMSLVNRFGWYTPVFTVLATYLFLGMEQIGTELEDPFERTVNDVDTQTISLTIERDLLALCRPEEGEVLPDA